MTLVDAFAILSSLATAGSVFFGLNVYKIQRRIEYFSEFRSDFSRVGRYVQEFDRALSPHQLFEAELSVYQSIISYRSERKGEFDKFLMHNHTKAHINRSIAYYINKSEAYKDCRNFIGELEYISIAHAKKFPVSVALLQHCTRILDAQLDNLAAHFSKYSVNDKYLNTLIESYRSNELDEIGVIETIASLVTDGPQQMLDKICQPIIDEVRQIVSSIEDIHVAMSDTNLNKLSQVQGKLATDHPNYKNFDIDQRVQMCFDAFANTDGLRISADLRDECIRSAAEIQRIYRSHGAKANKQ